MGWSSKYRKYQDVQVQQALWSTVRFAGVSDAVLKKAERVNWAGRLDGGMNGPFGKFRI